MKVRITKGKSAGFVLYDETTKEFVIESADLGLKQQATEYLNKKQTYRIPESQRLDDYREEIEYPNASIMHMELALCVLHTNTGIWVDWKHSIS